jgi:hypothetical protein
MGATQTIRPQLIALLLTVSVFIPILIVPAYPVGGRMVAMASHPYVPPVFQFPYGGRELFPDYRLVALYGTPGIAELGALGEQDANATIARVKALAATYQPLIGEHVYPSMEIISTVASATPTADGDYSYTVDTGVIKQWVAAARTQDVYVVLDLQPGRTDFLTQAKQFEELLSQPNVGLALDAEWRLGPNQKPLEQIGSVSVDEVNATVQWLANLTTQHKLPQKLFLLHEFRVSMLPNRDKLDTSHAELAYAIQMDGQGSQGAKAGTWQAIQENPPAGIHFGWKNFYKKDSPMRSPEETVQVSPLPWYISYQ